MTDADLIARMDAQRECWVDLPAGKRVQFLRPLEADFPRFRAGISTEHVAEYVCGWSGFTEADLLGASIGASDAVPFTPALWARVVRDRIEYVGPVAQAMVAAISGHLRERDATAKN